MPKKLSPDSPNRPRNVIKRQRRAAHEAHKRIMQQKKETETVASQQSAGFSVGSGSAAAKKKDSVPPSPSGEGHGRASSARDGAGEGLPKVFHADHVRDVKNYINRLKQKITLPFQVKTLRRGKVSTVLIINRDGRERELLPDRPGDHRVLCHRSVARTITSSMCVFSKITQSERIVKSTVPLPDGTQKEVEHREFIDGSWTIAPCAPAMLNGTTVQHVRRRPFFFLRRYWYEISFDGRVQPGGLFYDYGISPLTRRQRLYITHEYIPVRHFDAENDYFRFWRYKSSIPKP